MQEQLLRMPFVVKKTGLSRSSIYNLMKKDLFPRPVKVGRRAVAWHEEKINEFIRSCKQVD